MTIAIISNIDRHLRMPSTCDRWSLTGHLQQTQSYRTSKIQMCRRWSRNVVQVSKHLPCSHYRHVQGVSEQRPPPFLSPNGRPVRSQQLVHEINPAHTLIILSNQLAWLSWWHVPLSFGLLVPVHDWHNCWLNILWHYLSTSKRKLPITPVIVTSSWHFLQILIRPQFFISSTSPALPGSLSDARLQGPSGKFTITGVMGWDDALNMSVVAAWRMFGYLHDVPGSSTTHLDFRRTVALCLLKMAGERSSVAGGRHANAGRCSIWWRRS